MKQCPQCGNTYTNDELVFCLEDGAKLLGVTKAVSSFDQEKTLRIPHEDIPQLDAFKPQAAPTNRQVPPSLTTPPRTATPTLDNQAAGALASPTSRSTSPAIIVGITAIVVLLLVIAGLGVALLVRDSSSSQNRTVTDPNTNRAGNVDSTRNTSNSANDNKSTRGDNSSNKANGNDAGRNDSKPASAMERAESKVVRGTAVAESDIASLSGVELRRLRNTVYARHGRTFDSPDLQRYFDSRPWYKPRSDYDASELTETDRANIKLIQAAENGAY